MIVIRIKSVSVSNALSLEFIKYLFVCKALPQAPSLAVDALSCPSTAVSSTSTARVRLASMAWKVGQATASSYVALSFKAEVT